MASSTPKAMASATADLVRGASRRLSDVGNELRSVGSAVGREIRDIRREMSQRFQQGTARMEMPRISLPFSNGDHLLISPPGQDYECLPDEDEDCKSSHYDDEDYKSTASRLTIMRSPRTEAILKNVEQALRKTDKAVRDMLGVEAKKNLYGISTPKSCLRQAQHKRISAPPPSPSNFGLSARIN